MGLRPGFFLVANALVATALLALGCGAAGTVRQSSQDAGAVDGGAAQKPAECDGLQCGYGPMGGWCGVCSTGDACVRGKCAPRGADGGLPTKLDAGATARPDAGGAVADGGDAGVLDAGDASLADVESPDSGVSDASAGDGGPVADCNGKTCGDDDGAGGRCLGCEGLHDVCDTVTHTCICVGDCTGKYCGDADGCGGRCTACVNPDAACDAVTWRCEGLCPGGNCGCEPDCSAAWCGWDDGCGGRCTRCPDPRDACDAATGICGCQSNCSQKFCGRDDGCGGTCTGCPDPREHCDLNAKQCVCNPDCFGRFCGNDDGCGGKCSDCPVPGEVCVVDRGECCAPDCTGKFCGDDDGCGGRCDACPGDTQVCDTSAWTCCTPACEGRSCGQADGCGGICTGCSGPNEWCDPGVGQCVACDPFGPGEFSVCADASGCACGLDCVRCGDGCEAFSYNTPPVLVTGECLFDCTFDPSVCGGGQTCHCWLNDGFGGCAASACFDAGTVAGEFSTKTRDSCADPIGPGDIGSGLVTAILPGRFATFDTFIACRDTLDGESIVSVAGVRICGPQICPDVLLMSVRTSALVLGEVDFSSGDLLADWEIYTYAGPTLDTVSIAAEGVAGKVDFAFAGTGGRQPIGGTIDASVVRFDYEICGGGTGVPCQ